LLTLNQALDPTENYTNHVDEMVARAPHGTRTYAEDDRRVFALIVDFLDEANMLYIEDARMDEDGRAAYFMLYDHQCSASVVSLVITNAEIALRDANYQGDDRRHNWETFLAKMKQQHSILDYLCRRGLYAGIDDHSKVRYLLTAIRDPRLDAAKASCYDKDKLKDMDTGVHVLSLGKGFTNSSRKNLNVSAASSSSDATPWYANDSSPSLRRKGRRSSRSVSRSMRSVVVVVAERVVKVARAARRPLTRSN
jgi:hypothetical protein